MPRQTIRRMPGEFPGESGVGPFFPSGMSAPEAALCATEIPAQREAEQQEAEPLEIEAATPAAQRQATRS
jgi:hypothetical protein